MKSIDNKKAHQILADRGLIDVITKKVNNMSSLALSFNDVNFTPVQHEQQIWLTGSELSKALGYAKVNAVTQIYERNTDEFNASMTQLIENPHNLNLRLRIYSLRGCHLIAMFAKTAIAKQFRKWVLDVLDKEVGQPVAKTHKSERTALHEAHALLVTKTKHLNSSQAWKLIHQRFNVNDVADIPYDAIPVAVEYVHHLIALYSNTEKQKVEPWCNKDVQFVMWYLPMLHKFIKNEVYPALKAIQSNYAGRLIGLSEEVVGHANALNRQSIEHGTTVLNHVNNKPVHTLEWYFKN